MAIVVAILLILVAYFVNQNRALKKTIAKMTSSKKGTRKSSRNDAIYDQPFEITQGNRNDDMYYNDVRNDDEPYTALNRTGEDDDDHFYAPLNELQQNETGF